MNPRIKKKFNKKNQKELKDQIGNKKIYMTTKSEKKKRG